MIALVLVAAVTAGGLGVGAWGVRLARTTSDLFVASRAVSPWWNAAAISGEYLSAASFLGVAGLAMKDGASALWQPLGFAAGYLALLLFVAAPLRRYGAYTVADFAEGRLESKRLRVLCGIVVLVIAGLYLVPQLKGAGLALQEIVGAPYWAGILVVGMIVAFAVALGCQHPPQREHPREQAVPEAQGGHRLFGGLPLGRVCQRVGCVGLHGVRRACAG